MRSRVWARAGLALALASLFGPEVRAEEDMLPAIETFPCVTVCANATGPVPKLHPLPPFPKDASWYRTYVEGYVVLHYTITAEGDVTDIAVLELVGPQNFLDTTLKTIKDWTYSPATLEGKPVAVGWTMKMEFRVPMRVHGGRAEIARLYDQALQQIRESKFDEALAALRQGLEMENLNFYERGMLANLASVILLSKGDYLEAQRLTRLATDNGLDELKIDIGRALLETRIKASLGLGDIVDALFALTRLKAAPGGLEPQAPIVKLVENARANADSKPAFGTMAKIPEGGDRGAAVSVGLYRRNFAFTNISGSLDRFILNCKQQSIESKITETAEWHVPKNWSQCNVLVRGAPGTTFEVAQATE